MIAPTFLRRLWPLLLLCAVFSLFFGRVLFHGEVFFLRDHYQEYHPLKRLALEMVRKGIVPAWNPGSMMGQPFLANPNWTLLYPPNVFLLLGDFSRSYSLLFAAHFLVGLLGFYYLCRVMGRSRAASAAGSILFGCGGYFLSQGCFMPTLFTMTWQPLVLAEWLRIWQDPEPRRRWAFVGACTMMIAAGEPVTILATAILAAVLLRDFPGGRDSRRSQMARLLREPRWAAFFLLAAAVYPRLGFFLSSGRASGLPFEMAAAWPLTFRMMPGIAIPNLFGDVHQYFPWRLLGAYLTEFRFPYLLSTYVGVPCILLAAVRLSRRPIPLLQLSLSALSVLLAVGTATPLFGLFWKIVPMASLLRYPIKFLFFPIFIGALWASAGWDHIVGERRTGRAPIVAALAILALLVTTWLAYSPEGVARLLVAHKAVVTTAGAVAEAMRKQILSGALVLLATVLAMVLLARRRPLCLFCVIIADLFVANHALNPTTGRNFYHVPWLARLLASQEYRVMVLAPFAGGPGEQPESYDSYSQYLNAGGRGQLYALSGVDAGVLYAFDPSIDRSFPVTEQALIDSLAGKTIADAKPLLDLVATKWLLSPEKLNAPDLELRRVISAISPRPLYLYENITALPRVFGLVVTPEIRPAREHPARLWSGFDPRHSLLLDVPPTLDHSFSGPPARIEILFCSPVRISIRVTSEASAFVVCSDTYHPDWTAAVDGKATRVFLADGAFRAVEVPAGIHTVDFRCRLLRHYLSCAALLALCLLILAGLCRPRRARASAGCDPPVRPCSTENAF